MGWKIWVVNQLYPAYAKCIGGIDTGDLQTSIQTESPSAAENEIVIYGSRSHLSCDDEEELKAVISTVAAQYNLQYSQEDPTPEYYEYTLSKA